MPPGSLAPAATGDMSPVATCNRRNDETRLRRPKMKNCFFKKNLPILSEKLKLLRKVKVFQPSVTLFFENLMKRGLV